MMAYVVETNLSTLNQVADMHQSIYTTNVALCIMYQFPVVPLDVSY